MNKEINELREKFKKYNIDGYVVPKNDDYFTEYSKINRLKIISNFSGSAGLAIILKDKNYLFTDGRYTIQSEMESGKYFKIVSYEKIINCNLFKNLRLGLDPKLFTQRQIKNYFLKNNQIKFLSNNLIDEIENHKVVKSIPFFSLKDEIVGESRKSKINKIINYLKKNKADNLFVTAPENVAWILNIRGGDGPNSPVPNSRLIITKSKKIFLITEPYKAKRLIKEKIINKNQLIPTNDLPEKILTLSGKNFIIDNKSCSVFYENIIKSKFKIINREDPSYLLKAIKNNTEIDNMISSHVIDGVALTKFIYWIKKVNKKKITEVDAQTKLEKFRKKNNRYLYPSFETIAGAGENGAIVHYRAKKSSCRTIRKNDIFLCDSVVSINMVLLMLLEPSVLLSQSQVSKIFSLKS
jgi:Xaa-Pro aminopeptidase